MDMTVDNIGEADVYRPTYFKNFVCTMSECKYNCCMFDWTILIDERTYNKYLGLDEDEREHIIKNIKVVSENEKSFKAKIIMGKDGKCSLLNEQGLCSVQLKYGHDFLSTTCKIYPRKYSLVNGVVEASLTVSCEAVAKLILFDKNKMSFEYAKIETDEFGRVSYGKELNCNKYTSDERGFEIFWKLRTASIIILQSRQYRMRVRMLILCTFILEVEELFTSGRDVDAIHVADKYIYYVNGNHFDALAKEKPFGLDMDIGVTISILEQLAKENAFLRDCVKIALDGFEVDAQSGVFPASFKDDYRAHYERYLANNEIVFEQFMVNNVFIDGFPFNYNNEGNILPNYAKLQAKFDLAEFLLTGTCRFFNKFDKRKVIDCMSFFSRAYEHSSVVYI